MARSFYTALAEALLAGQPVPNLEAAQVDHLLQVKLVGELPN